MKFVDRVCDICRARSKQTAWIKASNNKLKRKPNECGQMSPYYLPFSMRRNDFFNWEIQAKPTKKNHATNKTDDYYIDDTWSMDFLDLNYYGPKYNKSLRLISVVIDSSSKFGWTNPLKKKKPPTKRDSVENILETSKSKRKLIEGDD